MSNYKVVVVVANVVWTEIGFEIGFDDAAQQRPVSCLDWLFCHSSRHQVDSEE